jgi:hypothetical protein
LQRHGPHLILPHFLGHNLMQHFSPDFRTHREFGNQC